jgi:glycosyltransferase involved in cell wall biosynthesis
LNEGSQYIVITPARNEQETIGQTIRSMAAQNLRPLRWVIVNDGSTDETASLIDQAARDHAWISAVHLKDRGFRHSGGGVIEAFYAGYDLLHGNDPLLLDRGENSPDKRALCASEPRAERRTPMRPEPAMPQRAASECGAPVPGQGSTVRSRDPVVGWDFLVKFDADLSFGPDYFQRCLEKFEQNPRLGIGGGMICQSLGPPPVREYAGDPPFHVRGATKIYRRDCWDQIGGLHRAPGWDTIDEVKANMLGWTTCTFEDVPLQHHRFAGSVDGAWKNWVKNGYANYVTGYHPVFMFIKCLSRLLKQPYFLGGFGLFCGYASGYFRPDQRVADKEMVRFLRREQWKRLFLRPSIWS